MKKILFILFLSITSFAWTQTSSFVFETKEMTFYGLDFSLAKCIGEKKMPLPVELINGYFPFWNDLFLGERGLKIGKPYKKKNVYYDTTTYAINREIETKGLIINEPYMLDKTKVVNYVSRYADFNKKGLGMVYIVEALNSKEKYASVWITFFDLQTGKVLITEPLRAKGKGRKYIDWYKNAFIKIYAESAKEYKVWKKVYK